MEKRFGFFICVLLFQALFSLPVCRASVPVSRAQDGVAGMELWCVAKNNAEDTALQSALDWACGPGAADCGPIQKGGPCYDPTDVQATASYAFNDYYLKHGTANDSCYFDNNAALTSLNPSHDNCKFPSSLSASNGSYSGSSSVTGLGSGAEISGCTHTGQLGFWTVISAYMFYMIAQVIS